MIESMWPIEICLNIFVTRVRPLNTDRKQKKNGCVDTLSMDQSNKTTAIKNEAKNINATELNCELKIYKWVEVTMRFFSISIEFKWKVWKSINMKAVRLCFIAFATIVSVKTKYIL